METELKIVYLPIDSLKPYEKNARQHKAVDVAVIKKSIEEFGMCDPIGIWGDKNIIVEGHGRLLALKELGYTEVPCIRLDHLTDEQRKAYALTHNRSAELSAWDFDILDEELKALEDEFDLDALGFTELMPEDEPEVTDDDFDEDVFLTETPESKLGDLYILGRHRLICGDSTKRENVDLLMNGEQADFILTDPPYNCDYEGSDGQKIDNDALSDEEFGELLSKAFKNMFTHCRDGANAFVFHRDIEGVNFQGGFKGAGFKLAQMWIWKKNSATFGRGWAHYQHEPIMVGWKEGAPHYTTGDRTLTTILEYDKPNHNDLHPTMKPLDLLGYLIQEGSKKGDLCVDLFGGSGST